jgi:hypothetical protein
VCAGQLADSEAKHILQAAWGGDFTAGVGVFPLLSATTRGSQSG